MIINTNLAGLNINRMMKINDTESQKTMAKLSSGKRINSAADDAAGLAISEKMKSQIRGLDRATLNTEEGIDLIQTSDGAMSEIQSSLQRMKQLSVQAVTGTNTDEDRQAIQSELTQLSKQIDSLSKTTNFNGIKTIDGSLRNISPSSAVETGSSVSEPISIHDDTSASISSSLDFSSGVEIHNGKEAVTEVTLASPFNITSPNNQLTINYTNESGNSTLVTLPSLPDSSNITNLAGSIQTAINGSALNGKMGVTYSTSPDKITFTSNTLSPNRPNSTTKIQIGGSAVSSMEESTGSTSTKSGVTRNDQLKITFTDKTTPATREYDEDKGFTILDSLWSTNTFTISIPDSTYTSVSNFYSNINSAISSAGYSSKLNVNLSSSTPYATGDLTFTTVNEGAGACVQLSDPNSTSNLNSILNLTSEHGQDKTDTFAIEINAQYTEKELNDEELSEEDMQKLLAGKTIYTSNGYTIEDPLNPDDFIQYTKVQDTGDTVQVTLPQGEYNKNDTIAYDAYGNPYVQEKGFATILQESINNSTGLGNDVSVTVNNNGGFDITTSQQTGANSSIKFTDLITSPSNKSPINTNDYEVLGDFLTETGFDCNRHVGKNGTGKLDIQVGDKSGDQVLVKIGSVRAGALGVKYLDVTTSEKASEAISIVDEAINKVSMERTNLGAFQNRFEHAISSQQNTSENLTSSQSGIEDEDMAKGVMDMSKNNVLQQAAQAMLKQANQQAGSILDLLK